MTETAKRSTSGRQAVDKRALYVRAVGRLTARDIADVFDDNPACAGAIRQAIAATTAGIIDDVADAKKGRRELVPP